MNQTSRRFCYISHQQTTEKIDDLRPVLKIALQERDLEPFYQNQAYEGNTILFGICKNIYLADMCIFELTKSYPEAYIELGVALAFNKPVVLLAEKDQRLPPILHGHSLVIYENYLDLNNKISMAIGNCIDKIYPEEDDFCVFCNQRCDAINVVQEKNSFLVLDKGGLLQRGEWEQIAQIVSAYFSTYRMYPEVLTTSGYQSLLCELKKRVYSARFSFCHPGNLSDEVSYLGAGLTIGKRYPWVLARKKGDRKWPETLEGVGSIGYESFKELSENLTQSLDEFAKDISPQKAQGPTTSVTMTPFWLQLDDWVEEQKSKNKTFHNIAGSVKLVHAVSPGVIEKYVIPPSGLTIGSMPSCDVIIDHEFASRLHAQITRTKNGNYYLEDLGSRNGTFLNGKRIQPRVRVKIAVNSIIRIPGAKFMMADDTSNMSDLSRQSASSARSTGVLNRIDLPNEFPPGGNEEDDYSAVLRVRMMPDGRDVPFLIQSYYRLGQVLSEVKKYFQVDTDDDYCFSLGSFEMIDKNTMYSTLNLPSIQYVYLRKFANLVTAVLTDHNFEMLDPGTSLPCINWIVSSPKGQDETNPQKYALFIKKSNISGIDISDLQTSSKILSSAIGASLLSVIVTADSLDSIAERIKQKAGESKVRILNYAALRASLLSNTKKAL